jgi:predicted nucleic acid-binding protein
VRRLDGILGREPIVIGDIVLTEVLQGFRRDADFRKARELFSAFEVENVLNTARAVRAAENHRSLRRRGITVRKIIDTLIATCCIDEGYWLLHADRDFEPFVRHLGLRELA